MDLRKHYFCKLSPSGNTTVFLDAGEFPAERHAETAAALMGPLHLGAEQVGFISREKKALRMMGGEFCVNATRAFACLLARDHFKEHPGAADYSDSLSVSGAEEAVRVSVLPNGYSEAMLAFTEMPAPAIIVPGISRVSLPGISHMIVTGPLPADPLAEAEALIKRHADASDGACGCIWLDADGMSMHPYVWVRATDTLCAETACGSGAVACAALLHAVSGAGSASFLQPSGERLDIALSVSPQKAQFTVGGFVRFIAEGFVYI
ncbi:MAG: hypothetical protein J5855_04440 [Mailhella sp.]|nr:hypothetical protein [Mailhella sp.]